MPFALRRALGYIAGFLLFYAPAALFQRALGYFLRGEWRPATIHGLCLRIPIEHTLQFQRQDVASVAVCGTALLLIAAFFFGPLFCGRLCPAGAATEYLSRLVPRRFQIDWPRHVEIAPVRYGWLAGYIAAPLFGVFLACAYCNFFLFDLFVNFTLRGYIVSLPTSLLLTALFWVLLLGVFTRGGRGYCSFFCPVGAVQTLACAAGRRLLPVSFSLAVDEARCNGCGLCADACPMRSVHLEPRDGGADARGVARVSVHTCILCGVCEQTCPRRAIRYGRHGREK